MVLYFTTLSTDLLFRDTAGLGFKVLCIKITGLHSGMMNGCFEPQSYCLLHVSLHIKFECVCLCVSPVEQVPVDSYTIPLSQAEVLQEGSDLTLVAWGTQVRDVASDTSRSVSPEHFRSCFRVLSPLNDT